MTGPPAVGDRDRNRDRSQDDDRDGSQSEDRDRESRSVLRRWRAILAAAQSRAVYNSRILIRGMLTPTSSWFAVFLSLVFWLLFTVPVSAQNWEQSEEQLARKLVPADGTKAMALEVLNRSSLSSAMADDIRRGLLTQLASLGVRFVPSDQASAVVRVSLSEDLQNYIWVAEIRQAANPPSIVMVSLPRSAPRPGEPAAAAMVLRKVSLWSQPERILDVAMVDDNPPHLMVLDSNGVKLYRLKDSRWQLEQSLPIPHTRPWPRDLRGRMLPGRDQSLEVFLPGIHCRGAAGTVPSMTCNDSDDTWPVGTDAAWLTASFTRSRNYFGGALFPGVGKQTMAPGFYSAAPVPRDQSTWWLLAAVDGQVHLLDGSTDQVLEKVGWGSDIAGVRSGCGSGSQVLTTGPGAGRNDSVRAFEVAGRQPVAASPALDVSGTITALWSESGGSSAIAVVHNSETERYEAFRLTASCGH